MNATKAIRIDWFDLRARTICAERELDKPGDLERISHCLRHEAFLDAIRPYLRLKARMLDFKIPSYVMSAYGACEAIVEWTEAEKRSLAQIDALIVAEAKRVGLPLLNLGGL